MFAEGVRMNYENIIFTILGGLITGLIGLLVEWWRERTRLRRKHFRDIKRKCLKPIRDELYKLRRYFEFGEGGPEWTSSSIFQLLRSEIRWWEFFSFSSRGNPILYEDLKNHYGELYQDLQYIERWVRNEYTTYLGALHELLELIENDPEFREFAKEFDNLDIPLKAVLFSSLGVDKSYWPNIYSQVEHKLDELVNIQNKFYNDVKSQKVREIAHHITTIIDRCISRIDEILLEPELRGRCKYISRLI
jgi:hypothetical protein